MTREREPWTLVDDLEALANGVEAGELIEPLRAFVRAADDLALRCEENGQHPERVRAYWTARYQDVPG